MTLSALDFNYIRDVVRQQSAIVLEPGKEYLVESRLLPLARALGADSISGLVSRMRSADRPVIERVIEAMTTNETSFFRDVHPFEALSKQVLPEMFAARERERRVSVWCGASSSGQEPYTLAMVLGDALASRPGFSADILATDISEEMLARTRTGRYSQLEVNRGLPATSLVRHFDRVGTEWQVKANLRAMVTTRRLNLAQPLPPIGQFDIVFLRNVLIYFDTPTKAAVLARVRSVLRPDGLLFLGGAESTLTIDANWDRLTFGRASAYRIKR